MGLKELKPLGLILMYTYIRGSLIREREYIAAAYFRTSLLWIVVTGALLGEGYLDVNCMGRVLPTLRAMSPTGYAYAILAVNR